jgi:hypothetical protein
VGHAEEDETGWGPGVGLPGGLLVASYLTAPAGAAAQYRLIVDTLLDEQARSLAGVSRPDLEVLLRRRLSNRPGEPLLALPLDRRLDHLVDWGVAVRWPGPAGDPIYQLTAPAARLHQAIRHLSLDPSSLNPVGAVAVGPDLAAGLGASVAASAAPPVLAAQLARLAAAVPRDPAAAAEAWSVLRTTLAAMTEATAGWRAGLAAALAGAADPARVAARQDSLRRDVDVWSTGVDRHGGPIAAHAARLLDAGAAAWRPAALHSLGAAVPEDRLSHLLDDYRATLTGLLAWFGPGDNAARRLRRQLRDVVAPRGAAALAAVRGQLSRRTDLLALAGALERSATDDRAWSLWCAATGLFAARHLPHPSPQPAGPSGTASFWAAEPAPAIQPRLTDVPVVPGEAQATAAAARIGKGSGTASETGTATETVTTTETGTTTETVTASEIGTEIGTETGTGTTTGTRAGAATGTGTATADQVARLPDRSAARAAARAAAAAHQAAAERTQHAIQARSGLRLSAWTGLDASQLDVLLSFLAILAGARPGQDGSRTVRTPDGRWTVRAEPAPDDAPPAVIRTGVGQLVHPDLRLTITAALPALAGSAP